MCTLHWQLSISIPSTSPDILVKSKIPPWVILFEAETELSFCINISPPKKSLIVNSSDNAYVCGDAVVPSTVIVNVNPFKLIYEGELYEQRWIQTLYLTSKGEIGLD